jgi:hypothetical protein
LTSQQFWRLAGKASGLVNKRSLELRQAVYNAEAEVAR